MSLATLLVQVSPRTPAGVLTWPAWQALRSGPPVLARELDPLWRNALAAADVVVEVSPVQPVGGGQVWFDAAPETGLARELAEAAVRSGVEVEVVLGSYDVTGSRLLDLVAVMDRLRSPGGCPWDARQTHASLLRHLVEETYEVVEAVETGTRADLREELGDLLLQVAFHARVAAEHPQEPFDIDDVAAGIVTKLVHRHPHVFGDEAGQVRTAEDVESRWERAKVVEKGRASVLDGIPASLPALARAEKVLDRLERHGVDPQLPTPVDLGTRLLADVAQARAAGLSAEEALRQALRGWEGGVRARERAAEA